MKIAHISDTHICLPQPRNTDRLGDLKLAIDEINLMNPAPQLVVHTGDITHNGQVEEYQAAYELLAQLNMPLYVIPGNKDRRREMREIFRKEMKSGDDSEFFQYAINFDTLRLVFLDTLEEGERLGNLCDARLNNLIQMLEEDSEKATVIFMHHPTFDIVEAPQPFQFNSQEVVDKFEKIVGDNRQIIKIYSGHSHRYGSHKLGDTDLCAISAIAIDLRWGDYGEEMRERPVYEVYDL